MDEDHYTALLEAAVRDWVEHEHPGDPTLAERAGRLAAGLLAQGASLGEACRATYAYVADADDEKGRAPRDGAKDLPTLSR